MLSQRKTTVLSFPQAHSLPSTALSNLYMWTHISNFNELGTNILYSTNEETGTEGLSKLSHTANKRQSWGWNPGSV